MEQLSHQPHCQRLTPNCANKETSLAPDPQDVGCLAALEEAPFPHRLVFAECGSIYTSRPFNEQQAVDTEA